MSGKGLNILSLFDGMSCMQIACKEAGIKINKYYASEIDKFAIQQTQLNFPETIQLGSVTEWKKWNIEWSKIDIISSGSPCQDLSIAGKGKGIYGDRSGLFWVFIDILNHVKKLNPDVKFLQENVGSAKKKDIRIMSEAIGIWPCRINSNLVSAQNRDRYYWTNISTKKEGLFGYLYSDIPGPKDEGIFISDILQPESEVDEKYYLKKEQILRGIEQSKAKQWRTGNKMGNMKFPNEINGKAKTLTVIQTPGGRETNHVYIDTNGKSPTQRSATGKSIDKKHNYQYIVVDKKFKSKSNQNKASCFTAGAHSGG